MYNFNKYHILNTNVLSWKQILTKSNRKFLRLLFLIAIVSNLVSCNQKSKPGIEITPLSNRIDSYLNDCVSRGFSGAILVEKKGTIILNKGYGFANKEKKILNTSETIYDICSVSKQFTASAILHLTESKKIKLTDSLKYFFSELPSDKENITIHQLLTHSAGFIRGIGEGDFDHIPHEEYFNKLFESQLLFQPGMKYEYSNAGYSILARIIELVSGKAYENYLNINLFKPSGMTQTGYLLPLWNENLIANEYLYNVSNQGNHIDRYKNDNKIAWPLKGNGGIHSTLDDMYKWHLSLKTNKVLSRESVEKLTQPYIPEDEDGTSYYAYGWAIFTTDRKTKIVTHNGFNGVTYFEFIGLPEEDIVIIFSSNSFTRPTGRIAWTIEKMLFDKEYKPEPIEKDLIGVLYEYTERYTGSIANIDASLEKKFANKFDKSYYLNRLGRIYLRQNIFDKAIAILKLNIQFFPNDGELWNTLGEAYIAANLKEEAIDSFKKALILQPNKDCSWYKNSLNRLEQLEL